MTDPGDRPRHEVALLVLRSLRARLRGMPLDHPQRPATVERVRMLVDEVAAFVDAGVLPPSSLEA